MKSIIFSLLYLLSFSAVCQEYIQVKRDHEDMIVIDRDSIIFLNDNVVRYRYLSLLKDPGNIRLFHLGWLSLEVEIDCNRKIVSNAGRLEVIDRSGKKHLLSYPNRNPTYIDREVSPRVYSSYLILCESYPAVSVGYSLNNIKDEYIREYPLDVRQEK